MDHLGERHELALGVGPIGEVGDGALLDPLGHVGEPGGDGDEGGAVVGALVERRDVDALELGEVAQEALAAACRLARHLPRRDHLADLGDDLLAVAEHDDVDEVGERLGVEGAVAPDHDEQVVVGPAGGVHRHAGEVDALEDVGVGELGGEVEGEQVEVAGGAVRVDAEERDAGGAELVGHVGPRAVGPLGDGALALVEDLVEDLEALVGQADLVGVGVGEEPGGLVGGVHRRLGAVLHADVASGLLHERQQALELGPDAAADAGDGAHVNRRECTLSTRPMAANDARVAEPP